jgi:hypothetical protein
MRVRRVNQDSAEYAIGRLLLSDRLQCLYICRLPYPAPERSERRMRLLYYYTVFEQTGYTFEQVKNHCCVHEQVIHTLAWLGCLLYVMDCK